MIDARTDGVKQMMESRCRKKNVLSTDVLVAGGGIAGVCAALSAARSGVRVIFCQDRPVLGGNASSEIRMHICGAAVSGRRGKELEVEARESGIVEEIRLENVARNSQKSWSMMDFILYEKCIMEKNLVLMLNTTVVAADVSEDSVIRSVKAVRESTEDEFEINASVFIDCTGDGRLGAEAGAMFRVGREAAEEFNESMAEESADTKTLGSSLMFESRDVGQPIAFVRPNWARSFTEEQLQFRDHQTVNSGYWWLEWGGHLDTIKDNEIIRHELLRILMGVWDHIKNQPGHPADHLAIDWFGQVPGKRESRRFVGLYTFSQEDAWKAKHFEDVIAYGGWPMDTHPPKGIDSPGLPPCHQPIPPHLYSIPLRCCISKNIQNLMFAGRNISATHIGFSSLRVMGTCGVIGQGVGTAAAEVIKNHIRPAELVTNQHYMLNIQKRLLDDDCFLPGLDTLEDNVVLPDHVTASAETPDGLATNTATVVNRAVFGPKGIHPRYVPKGTNRWIGKLGKDTPAVLEFHWDKPVEIEAVKLVFDSGLHRPLMLTKDTSCRTLNETMLWQIPPELVKAYCIEYAIGSGPWKPLVAVDNNYQRVNRHRFEPVTLEVLRLTVTATCGINAARVVTLSCYQTAGNE